MNTETSINRNVINRLVEFGVKPSLQRIAIMEYLMNNATHPTADLIYTDLYPYIPTLSKTTVYNTLKLLEEHGAIQVISIDDKNLRYDADISHHAHSKCKLCGCVNDLPLNDISIFNGLEFDDFIITEYQVYYKGYCKKCNELKNMN